MNKPSFIAEVSSNHNQDLQRCLEFVDVAADIGCDAVKFQLFKLEELFAPEILEKSPKHRERKKWELPVSYLSEISKRCKKRKIKFSCTPFYLDAVDELYPYLDFFKIASYELLWHDLFKKCATTNKPVMFSTGMATMDEVVSAITCLKQYGCSDINVLHCNSAYPTPASESNLQAIVTLKNEIGKLNNNCHQLKSNKPVNINVGWSDHTVSPAVIYRAVFTYEVKFIEFHLDLDGVGEEFSTGHCWLPDQIETVIKTINTGFSADGNGTFNPSPSELPDRSWRADPIDGLRPLKPIRDNF